MPMGPVQLTVGSVQHVLMHISMLLSYALVKHTKTRPAQIESVSLNY